MAHWLKMLGTGTGAMDEEHVPSVLREIGFPRKPSVRVGDKVVLYALGHDRVFAIVQIYAPPFSGDGSEAWHAWRCEVREAMSTSYADAPSLDALCVPGARNLRASMRQHSHIKLTPGEYEQAVAALRQAGAREDSLYRS